MNRSTFFAFISGILLLLVGCSNATTSAGAAGAVEAYLQALVAKDANRISSLSCASWESQGRQELDSFSAVTTSLKDLRCQVAGKDGEATLVTCSGKIVANYNGENQELNLSDRTYRATNEGGEWRMCGYR